MGGDIRRGQLIVPFGPGSIYTDKYGVPLIVCGLDHWYSKSDDGAVLAEQKEAVRKHTVIEPRLSDLLGVPSFREPPEYIPRRKYNDQSDLHSSLTGLMVDAHRFPRWYFNTTTGQLKRFNLETRRLQKPEKGQWRAVRFVSVCESGHISDFPWKAWAGCTCDNDHGLYLHDSGGVDLGSIAVECKQCEKKKSLAGMSRIKRRDDSGEIESTGLNDAGICCQGERLWLGDDASEGRCDHLLAGALINQSNIYFARTQTAIFLPELGVDSITARLFDIFSEYESGAMVEVRLLFQLNEAAAVRHFVQNFRDILDSEGVSATEEEIRTALRDSGSGKPAVTDEPSPSVPESELLGFRRSEFNILKNEVPTGASRDLRILKSRVAKGLSEYFSVVNLVERLRETKVFFGFDRLQRKQNALEDMPESALRQLFRNPPAGDLTWLPAVKSYGEGVFLQISEPALQKWLDQNADWLSTQRYSPLFVERMANEQMLLPPSANITWRWAARYQLVHTLSHVLINQCVFESGYSSAALKERLFVSSDPDAPMAGVLIYTASGDSEGSLGGLVRLGRTELFEQTLHKAIIRASWCSTDPVCSENTGGKGTRLVNLAACHACALLPETACETLNNGLDRAALVGTPENPGVGFFADLLKQVRA